jgi:peptide/nickel transport system substrate-binding protein
MKSIRLCLRVLTGALLLLGCQKEDLLDHGILVVGLEANPTCLDPRISTDASSSRINELLYGRLFRKNEAGEPVEDLVEDWEQTDPVTYRFRLREGVRFDDGRTLEAEDVRYTFQTMMDPALGSPLRSSYQAVDSVECPDPRTIVFRLREPFAPLVSNLDLGILPRPRQEGVEADRQPWENGSGPFRFVSWTQNHEIRLEANPGYFGGAPRIREIRFRIVPDDTVRTLELRKGTIHLLQNDIEPEVLRTLEREGRFTLQKRQGTNYAYMGFNLKDPILRSREVRQAIAHAIDRNAIIEHLLGGLAVPATGVLSSLNWAYEPAVETYEYDPEKARRLLDEAGYEDPDGPGPARRFGLTYKTSQNELRRRIGEAIQGFLGEVGIEVGMRSYEWGTFFSDIRKGNFQLYTLTWVGITDPDIFTYLFHSRSLPPDGANRGSYLSPEVDRLIEQGRVLASRQERKAVYGLVQKILAADLPYVSLWNDVNVVVMDRRIRGFVLRPDGDFFSLKDVWIEPASPK